MKPFIDLAGEAIQLLTTALGRLLLGKDESKPQTRRPGISNLQGPPLSVCEASVTGDEVALSPLPADRWTTRLRRRRTGIRTGRARG